MPVAYLHSLAALLPRRSSLTVVRCSADATDPGLTTPEMPRRIELFLDQIEHMVEHVGEDGVGLGLCFRWRQNAVRAWQRGQAAEFGQPRCGPVGSMRRWSRRTDLGEDG
jgi:hypothetical protein